MGTASAITLAHFASFATTIGIPALNTVAMMSASGVVRLVWARSRASGKGAHERLGHAHHADRRAVRPVRTKSSMTTVAAGLAASLALRYARTTEVSRRISVLGGTAGHSEARDLQSVAVSPIRTPSRMSYTLRVRSSAPCATAWAAKGIDVS